GNRPSKPDSRPGGGTAQRPSQQPSRPGTADRPGGADRPGSGTAGRPSQLPSKPGTGKPGTGAGVANRPGGKPSQLPSKGDVGNFLGIAGGAAAGGALGGALANRPSQLPADRPGLGERPGAGERPARPEQRPDWSERSQNRNEQWEQRVDNRNDAWNQRSDNRQQARNDFQQNRDERWNNLESARDDRQNWRNENREDWQKHREDLWEYRGDRAEEIRDNARDFYDDVFDDRWWGACGWGVGWAGNYPVNPWWWWRPVAWGATAAFVDIVTPDPVYIDYGMNVIYEGDTVYVDNQPVPAAQYTQPMIDLAVNVEQPPPPLPPPAPAPGGKATAAPAEEWLPLGVFALAQEEKGDPVLFLQLSVNRAGVISGAYNSTLTDDQRPIAGQIDKTSQRVAWRIGDNTETIFITTLANLTKDVAPVAIHFGKTRTQTWLLVRMPEPAEQGQPATIPPIDHKPPPLAKAPPKSGK
ncbi:MAG TPA: hypothetical protein VGJ26_15785, partial [Pirellulales bacterium]